MKALIIITVFLAAFNLGSIVRGWRDNRQTIRTISTTSPPVLCTNIPNKFQEIGERLAWFYGCIHRMPPSRTEIQAELAALPPERRAPLAGRDSATQEALMGIAKGDLPPQIFPK